LHPDQIRLLREKMKLSVDDFGAKFERSGRTVEDWEQGRRKPDRLVVAMMFAELEKVNKRRRKA
jgi:DNA-binding transcriptional regulator YiaG